MCTPVTPAVPYLLLGLQDVQRAVGNSRGARKLARTPYVNHKKKKKKNEGWLVFNVNYLALMILFQASKSYHQN
jgi:hypothetical protein